MTVRDGAARRDVLIATIAALGSLVVQSFSIAQSPARIWRIGVLNPRTKPVVEAGNTFTTFFAELRDLGYADGKNIAVQWQSADNEMHRLPELAAQLAKARVDLIVTLGTPAVRVAQQATATIPILALAFADPVGSGFAKSLSRPGGNITGITILSEDSDDGARTIAQFVAQILKGAKPADLPIRQPTQFELAINLKTAKAPGIKIPPEIMVRANKVYE